MEMEKKDRWVAINRTLGSLALSTRAFKGSVGILFYRLKYRWFLVRPVSHPLDEDHRTHKGVYLSSIPSRCPHIDFSISLFSSRPWNLRNYECFASLIRSFENGHPVDLVALKRYCTLGCRLTRRLGEGVVHIHESTYVLARAEAGKGREENEKGSNWNCARMEHITVVSFMSFEFEKRSRIKHDNRPFRGPFGGQGKARLLCERLERLVGVNLFFFLCEWKVIWETPSRITGLFHSFNSSKYTRIILYHYLLLWYRY